MADNKIIASKQEAYVTISGLATDVDNFSKDINDVLKQIEKDVDQLGKYWNGEGYTNFKSAMKKEVVQGKKISESAANLSVKLKAKSVEVKKFIDFLKAIGK